MNHFEPGPIEPQDLRVLHIVATAARRGAELFASDLVQEIAESGTGQQVAILRSTGGANLEYDAPTVVLDSARRGASTQAAARWLRTIVRDWRPQVIQAHGGEALKYAWAATVLNNGTRVVYRRIGSAYRLLTRRVRRVAYGQLMRRADRVVAVSDAVRAETMRTFHVAPERILTIPNGVDSRRFRPSRTREETRRELEIPLDAPVVACIGAFTHEKDPLAHVDVAERVIAELPEARFLFAGDGPMRRQVQARIHQLGLGERVLQLGLREDVPDLLEASDVLVLASATEGMPAVVIEAGMLGVPVAAYRMAGVPEVVVDGETGLLSAPGDTRGLARSVLVILGDPDRRQRMAAAARRWCTERFDIRRIAPRYLEIYREVAQR